jgi:hypothetical protein
MSKKLITTIALVFAVAAAATTPTALANPQNTSPNSPGVCNMFHVGSSTVGFAGMNNSSHGFGYGNMLDLVTVSGCLG